MVLLNVMRELSSAIRIIDPKFNQTIQDGIIRLGLLTKIRQTFAGILLQLDSCQCHFIQCHFGIHINEIVITGHNGIPI